MTAYSPQNPIDLESARQLAEQTLSPRRYHHTACVVKAADELARRYGADPLRAQLAAWMHDILKERDAADLLQRLQGSDIIDFTHIADLPSLWHAYAGGLYAKQELGLDDEIANAVMYHTAGRAGMSTLEKVVFLADYISEDRDFRGADEVRRIAETSLDDACLTALRNGIVHICKMGKSLDVNSVYAFNDFVQNGSKLHG